MKPTKSKRDRWHQILSSTLDDAWDIELGTLSRAKRYCFRVIRVFDLVLKGFRDDKCHLHASALTFNTLMSIIPLLAFSLFMANGFGAGDLVESKIRAAIMESFGQADGSSTSAGPIVGVATNDLSQIVGSTNDWAVGASVAGTTDEVQVVGEATAAVMSTSQRMNDLVTQIFEYVERVNFAALGGVGLMFLFWFVVQALGRVESSFNIVWGVRKPRNLLRKFTDYLFVMVVFPILVILSSSLPVVEFMTRFMPDAAAVNFQAVVDSVYLKRVMVLVMTTLSFTFLYTFMPNTRVRFVPGLAGGLTTALVLIAWLSVCANLQVGVARANAMYGSFAIFPIVLAWVHVSWQVVMFGAEMSFAVQNHGTIRVEQNATNANVESFIVLSLAVMADASQRMCVDGSRFDVLAFARENRIPVRLLNQVVESLVKADLLVKIDSDGENYVMTRAPDSVEVTDILDMVMKSGAGPDALGFGHLDPRLSNLLAQSNESVANSLQHLNIRDLMADDKTRG